MAERYKTIHLSNVTPKQSQTPDVSVSRVEVAHIKTCGETSLPTREKGPNIDRLSHFIIQAMSVSERLLFRCVLQVESFRRVCACLSGYYWVQNATSSFTRNNVQALHLQTLRVVTIDDGYLGGAFLGLEGTYYHERCNSY